MEEALMRAKAAVGGSSALSRAINSLIEDAEKHITPQAVSQWKVCPSARVLQVEAATGVSREDLRPDLYKDGPLEAELPREVANG